MDPLEKLVEDFSKELTPDGWTVLLWPGLGTPDKEGEHREIVFSGFQWNAQMRKEVAMMLIAIVDITRAEAEWLIRAGTPIGSKRNE